MDHIWDSLGQKTTRNKFLISVSAGTKTFESLNLGNLKALLIRLINKFLLAKYEKMNQRGPSAQPNNN